MYGGATGDRPAAGKCPAEPEGRDMLLRELGEFGFIDRIATGAAAHPQVVVGIGDDAAVLDLGGPEFTVVTTDAHFEGHHFSLQWMSPAEVGWRAASAALSDIAAMGARPIAVFCTCALPPSWDSERAEELLGGLRSATEAAGAALAGGDTVADDRVALDVVVVGSAPRGQVLLRSGARPGQVLAVTGALGATGAALAMLAPGGPKRLPEPLRERFVRPQPRIAAGRALAASGRVAAAMDISDGLVQDAGHIARRSGVAITIQAGRAPIAEGCREAAEALGADPLLWALTGGEDFELLIALDEDQVEPLAGMPEIAELGLAVVGSIAEGTGVRILDAEGREMELPRGGWDHFA